MNESRNINIAEMSKEEFTDFLRTEVGGDINKLCELGEQLFEVWRKATVMSQALVQHAESLHPDFMTQLQKHMFNPSSATIQ